MHRQALMLFEYAYTYIVLVVLNVSDNRDLPIIHISIDGNLSVDHRILNGLIIRVVLQTVRRSY